MTFAKWSYTSRTIVATDMFTAATPSMSYAKRKATSYHALLAADTLAATMVTAVVSFRIQNLVTTGMLAVVTCGRTCSERFKCTATGTSM
jgi:hypothetical protein